MTSLPTSPEQFTIEHYRAIFRSHPAAVAIITLMGETRPVGFTATSVVSVSADPAVIVFSIMATSSSWPELSRSKSVVLHFLDETEVDIAERFAISGIDRFEGMTWHVLPTGEPVLDIAGSWVRCSVLGFQEVGGSVLVQVRPTLTVVDPNRSPLVYHERAYHRLGCGSRIGL